MNARRSLGLLVFGLVSTFSSASLVADDAKSDDPLAPFGRFVGGTWESEGDFKIRVAYEWGLNKKLLKIKSFILGQGEPQLVYESVVYVHPGKKQIVFQSISARGSIFDGVMTNKGNVYESIFTSYDGDKKSEFRQLIELTDDDHAVWKVFAKDGDGWKEQVSVKEHRVKDVSAK